MNRAILIAGGATLTAAGLALATNKRARDGASDAVAAVSKAIGTTRGFRNNNPGNIREGQGDRTAWEGERSTDDDGAFEEFVTPEYGFRALVRLLDNYRTRYGLHTVAGIIGRYAPASENNTARYIEFVADHLRVRADQAIDTQSTDTMLALVDAITRFENGGNPYSARVMRSGLDMARSGIIVA